MPMNPIRTNTALAIDGGGVRGLMVARALIDLEAELHVSRLIEHPSIRVLAGTSTGAIISAGIALGLSAKQLTELYLQFSTVVFPPLLSSLPQGLREFLQTALGLFVPALFSSKALEEQLVKYLGPLTLGDLDRQMAPQGKAMIITAVDINERRTRFLKTSDPKDHGWRVVDAVLASSAAPTYLPVFKRREPGTGEVHYFTDGGVGNYTNPAAIAARELIEFMGSNVPDCTVLSFGTGYFSESDYKRGLGRPDWWRIPTWARKAIELFLADGMRAQSLDIYNDYVTGYMGHYEESGLDFRRYQMPFPKDLGLDDASQPAITFLQQQGEAMGKRIRANQFAPNEDLIIDPEGIHRAVNKFRASREAARQRYGPQS